MSEHDSQQSETHDELTAYLDGELDAEAVRRVEERLARDSAYRAELRQLERAWDLLDRLPRAVVDEAFTRTTIEMVAVAASEEAAAIEDELPKRFRRQRLWGVLGACAAGVAGFFIGWGMRPNPNEQLLKDLPVLKNFELYYQADDIGFLRMLDDKGLFDESEGEHAE